MKLKFIWLPLVILLSHTSKIFAISLDLSRLNQEEKLGIFPATFDPPTLHHRELIEKALQQEGVDKIIVLTTPPHPLKPNPSPLKIRREMVEKTFEHDPNILTVPEGILSKTKESPLKQISKLLRAHGFKTLGIVQLDDISGTPILSHLKRITIAHLIRPESWLIQANSLQDYNHFKFTWYYRNRNPLIFPTPPSSQLTRDVLQSNPNWYGDWSIMDGVQLDELAVEPPARKVIFDHKLYSKK